MGIVELILLSIGLSMDAFAVSLSEGLSMQCFSKKMMLKIGLVFGIFQGVMPFIGWNVGAFFSEKISKYNGIISFILLFAIGLKMIYDGYKEGEDEEKVSCEKLSKLIYLGVATSIDALVIGFSLAMNSHLNIYFTIEVIGLITFFIASTGVYLGYKVGQVVGCKTEYIGGGILILIAIKNLIFS